MNPRLLIRKINESSQRENWVGFALYVQAPLVSAAGTTWLEKRLTPDEHAGNDPAKAMAEGQEWAKTNGFVLPRGWAGGEDGVVGYLEAAPKVTHR